MSKIGIFYGSTTGNTEMVAQFKNYLGGTNLFAECLVYL